MSAYGTVPRRDDTNNINNDTASEEDALLPRKNHHLTTSKRVHRHLNVDVYEKYGDLILLLCYIITGLLDSCAAAAWGSFVSMQTGNTIYFGLGVANPTDSDRWIKSGISIVMFCLGSFCFARFHRFFSPKKRWVLTASYIIQLLMIVAAACITMYSRRVGDSKKGLHWHILVPLALVAFQSSGQAVTSRVLKYGGLTSVVLTSIYCDLFSDAQLFAWPSENIERNRRASAPILLLIGAVGGGLWSKSDIGMAGALWTAAGLKALIVVAWLIWKEDPKCTDED